MTMDNTDTSFTTWSNQSTEFTSFSTWSSQTAELFHVTMVPTLYSTEMTLASTSKTKTDHGCLIQGDFVPNNNPHNIITKKTEFWISTIDSAGLIPLLFLVGVPGNILSTAVFYKQGLRERINLCIFCLAIVDLLVITVTFLLSAEQIYIVFIGPSSFFIQYFVGLTGFTWVSMFLSAVIAAERCFCVVSPLRAQRVLSTRTMAVFITITSLVLLTGMLAIAGHKHIMACIFDPKTNTTSQTVYVTEYYLRNKEILDIFDVFVYASTLPAIFMVIIFVTTSITAVKLRSALKWRQQTSSNKGTTTPGNTKIRKYKREEAMTKMLIATSVLFMICLSPMLLVQITMFLVPELKYGGHYHNLTVILWSIISVFRCVNSSLNFFVYFHMGSRFRRTLKQLLCCTTPVDSTSQGASQSAYVISENYDGVSK